MAIKFTPPTSSGGNSIRRANQLFEQGRHLESLTMCNQLLKKHPKDPAIWSVLVAAQMGAGDAQAARKSAIKGLRFEPKSLELRCRLGLTYMSEHRFSEAETEFAKAMALDPNHAWPVRCIADAMSKQGKDDEAFEILHGRFKEGSSDPGLNLGYLKICLRTKRYDEGLRIAEPLIANESLVKRFRAAMLFVIAELYDKSGQCDRAFEVYTMANGCAGDPFDRLRHREGIDRVIEAWTPEAVAKLDRPTRKTDSFVFILGMPRSGTSLVEQIIASHPKAHGCGELNYMNNISVQMSGSKDGWSYLHQLDRMTRSRLDEAAQLYTKTVRSLAPGAALLTDKMPANLLHAGLICAMLPQSKIIHCIRDPRDTCVSCYFHHFLGKGNSYTYDLEDLGSFFTDYWRLMKHWKRVLDIPILDVVYEDMIADQEAQSRRLIEFLGLEWDDKCLDFHKTKRTTKTISADQVNKPIYRSSIARWKKYEKHLGPLLDGLPADALRDEG